MAGFAIQQSASSVTKSNSNRPVDLAHAIGHLKPVDPQGEMVRTARFAGGAHIILIPEIPFTLHRVCEQIGEREKVGRRFTIVVVAEGVKLPPELKENRRASTVGNLIGNAIATVRTKK